MSETSDNSDPIDGDHYINELNIDADSLPATSPEMQHERRVAIFDLLEDNVFRPLTSDAGPYIVDIALRDASKLIMKVKRSNGAERDDITLSLTPFRRIVKDYFMICESYHNAIRTATSAQIEAIDMGRRGLHNEGSRLLTDSLRNQAEIDFNTSRRLFTLICSLHRRT
ncbi:UPF0262 family protein [Fretibacter rubidus]|uniref:UPF0262 family protein n=1 Tax=Fretibacter rubidus TaxID=570162 RepID=UPI00352B6288